MFWFKQSRALWAVNVSLVQFACGWHTIQLHWGICSTRVISHNSLSRCGVDVLFSYMCNTDVSSWNSTTLWYWQQYHISHQWVFYQIRKIAGYTCAGNAGNVFPATAVGDPGMHHGTCVTHVPWCMPGSLTSGFFWSRWWGKRSRHSRRMHNPQFCVSGKRPIEPSTLYVPGRQNVRLLP